ncbi:alpha-(1,3)-fucosyltransferase C-like [Vanessa tameamea]|uniref:Fucosyltransferase n=1 Tax=Vanessa tameamea TaxID=334116 RepID=A0A8B8IAZ5_VANTA
MVCLFNITKYSTKSLFYFCICFLLYVWFISYLLKLGDDITSIFTITQEIDTKAKWNKYILIWTNFYYYPQIKKDKLLLRNLNCSNSNCVLTKNKALFDDYTRFDAIIFNDDILISKDRPLIRNHRQIYIFNTLESSYSVPACEVYNDGFFNWTFTYRLDSDIVSSYFVVRNLKGAIVAPRVSVKWHTSSGPIAKRIRAILRGKRKAAAWLVSHCKADSLRDEYLTRLQEHLFNFGLKIDVYGKCSHVSCPDDHCGQTIKKNYYFYIAFENSLSEDYVTEKVLHGYNNYAVPIVYGGANYSRFLPPSSYINAREMHPYNLAFAMYEAIQTPALYEKYFKWTNLYTISSDFKSNHPLCKLCYELNHNQKRSSKEYFRKWWNGLNGMKWCLSNEYWTEASNVNIDARHIFNLY